MTTVIDNAHVINQLVSPPSDNNQLHCAADWTWQKVTSNTIEDIDTLASLLNLDSVALAQRVSPNRASSNRASSNNDSDNNVLTAFKLRVPLTFVSRMQAGNLDDPLLLQVLPQNDELLDGPTFSRDPLNEQAYNVAPGLVHKYRGRVLLTAAVSCPINCRYCFRRHFPYAENRLTPNNWSQALDYIRSDTNIKEVILSGGEPLLLNDRTISELFDAIESIEHIKHIRIHSRFPIVVPQRLTDALCQRLQKSRCNVALVLHANHPNEIDATVKHHLENLARSRVTLLNQSVLLHGINNDAEILSELSEKLYDAGVLPYYLHATDPVVGTAHFQVDDQQAQQIALALTHKLPGYLVPTLVREVSGESAKTRLAIS